MGKFRGVDSDPGWINRRFAEIDRRLREQAAAKRLPGSSIAEGTDFSIRGTLSVIGQAVISGLLDLTGTMSMKSATGTEMVRLGDMTYGRGLTFGRSDGSQAFRLNLELSNSTTESWAFTDRAGRVVMSEGTVSPGLLKPFLELPFQPYAATSGTSVACGPYGWERTSTSGTWETLFLYDGKAQNSFLDFKFAAKCSDATTAGEIQIYDLNAGAPLAAFLAAPWVGTIAAGTTTMTVIDPSADQAVMIVDGGATQFGDAIRLGVQVRRTAGTGTITLAIPSAMGG